MNVRLDATQVTAAYSKAFRQLSTLSGFDHRIVLRAEMGIILKTWAGETKVGTVAAAIRRARSRAAVTSGVSRVGNNFLGTTVNTGRAGGAPGLIWFKTRQGKYQMAGVVADSGTVRYSWLHYKKEGWEDIDYKTKLYARNLVAQLKYAGPSVGLSRQSVVQSADALGIDLAQVAGGRLSASGLAKARAAIASTGKSYINGFGSQGGNEVQAYIEAINRLPYASRIGMDSTLVSILNRRAKYIAQSYAKGAFDSSARVARAFPNLIRVAGDPGMAAAA